MTKWILEDLVTTDTITLEINPSSAKMGGYRKSLTEQAGCSPTGQRILFQGRNEPQTLSLSGVIFSEGQYNTLLDWSQKNYQFKLTDDLNRDWWIYITSFRPKRRRDIGNRWLVNYDIEATVLDWS